MRSGLRWLLPAIAAVFVHAAMPVICVGHGPQVLPVPGAIHIAAADDNDGDDDDDRDDDRDDGGDDGEVQWRGHRRDRGAGRAGHGAGRTSRRAERSKAAVDGLDDVPSSEDAAHANPTDGDDGARVPARHGPATDGDAEARVPARQGPATEAGVGRAVDAWWLALSAIAGTAAIVGGAYWLMSRPGLHPAPPARSHAHLGEATDPADRGVVTMADAVRRSATGWRWRPGPDG